MCIFGFLAHGHGAKGDNIYTFQIEFLEPVNPKPVYKVTQRQLNITVKKEENHWWERLTKQEKRPLFLAPDFDRWLDESDAEMELKAKEEERINKMSAKNRIPKDPFRHLKRGYLFMYNLVQFLGFSWIFVNMTVRLFMLGKDSFSDTFHMSGDMMYFCQMFALMEIVNALIGLVKAPLAPVCIQVIPLQTILESFSFYPCSLLFFKRPFNLSFLLLAVAVIQAIPIFTSTGKFSFTLNYPLNITIPFSVVLQLHLIFLFLAPFILFRHLYKQRQRRLGPKKRKMH
ncbi:very-long-chain (3R)-3-hydroxyacyl-CoA dehydratase 3 [Pseudonaja textilis]|uniref:very-long-chain (3R)-3-hydroxyacyl-CoA dehydratase 3 n=1 Tax=Pseudonaja textilis TaxID=8673 RepID=UPI000EA85845|nr:very-long-chain (3R)-3-hydroxyacyl-CoA dehydratase 3 [Pseudonaja textilis]